MSTEELIARVLRLPAEQRARVARELLDSLEEPEEQVAAAWASELERRVREVEAGRVELVPWGEARRSIVERLAGKRREAGSSS